MKQLCKIDGLSEEKPWQTMGTFGNSYWPMGIYIHMTGDYNNK
jgi:hypothetical protein